MKFRSWWFFAFWASAGVLGLWWLFPGWLSMRIGGADRASFEYVAAPPPHEETATGFMLGAGAGDSRNAAPSPPVVLKEVSPSDHASGFEAILVSSPDEAGSATAGIGMVGAGSGGGGTGIGSIGYGSSAAFGKSEAAAAPPQAPALPQAEAASAQPRHSQASVKSAQPWPKSAEPIGGGTNEAAAEFDGILDEIDRKLAHLPLGNIAFNAPETIPLGETAAIELLVSLAETAEQLREAVRAPGPVESASVHVSPYMEAQLSGVGFRIESATPARQLLSRSERTRWRWQIEPSKADTLELTLTLSALFSVDGQERTRVIRTFEKTIVIDVPITHRVARFLGNNQEWIGTVLIVPLLGALYRLFRRKRPAASSTPSEIERRAA